MPDWFRTVMALGLGFAAVTVATLGLAGLLVPGAAGIVPPVVGPGPSGVAGPSTPSGPPTRIGGTLAVSGDLEATIVLDRESIAERYAVTGQDGRVIFDGANPPGLAQMTLEGWDFFLDPGDCELTPGERHDPTGVAGLGIRCVDVAEVRDKGTVTVEGTIGVAATLLGLRGDLPDTGGSVMLGDETLTFESAFLAFTPFGGAYAGQLVDEEQGAALTFDYDAESHGVTVAEIQLDGELVLVPAGACAVSERGLGVANPHTRVSELTLDCAAVELPSGDTVPLRGNVVVDIVEAPR